MNQTIKTKKMEETIQLENQIINTEFRHHSEIQFLLREESSLMTMEQNTNVQLCKLELIRRIKFYLVEMIQLLSSNAKDPETKTKVIQIIESLSFQSIRKNLESMDKKSSEINNLRITYENEETFCLQYLYKRILTTLDHNKRKVLETLLRSYWRPTSFTPK